ncbi:MAG: 3-phosphoshikimate 1-carboxyvinyltransferase [Brevinematales bacterium]|nr:3-phosphoshikimate 1-carboxyvinyltransferase [Brevinematales bacterium]
MDKIAIDLFKGNSLDFEIYLPGSKSITNRAFIISSLAKGETKLSNVLFSDDTKYMMKTLEEIGVDFIVNENERTVVIKNGKIPKGGGSFFVGNAGTAMRFLTSYLSLGNGKFILDGDERMRERPIRDLVDCLTSLGVDIKCVYDNDCPPVEINANGVKGGKTIIEGKNSSQYLSSVLMASPYFASGLEVEVVGELASKPYVDMTIDLMKKFDVEVVNQNYKRFIVRKKEYISPQSYFIEPDASTASYFLAAIAILSGRIKVFGLGKSSIQGDVYFAEILSQMGCEVNIEDDYIELYSEGELKGIEIDMNKVPDLVPTLAIVALFANGITRIYNVANLRIKESDRIKALVNEIKKIGGEADEFSDGLEIHPMKSYKGALISTYNDHRIAMSFAIAGLKINGIEIENPGCVSKSFPEFFDYLKKFFN